MVVTVRLTEAKKGNSAVPVVLGVVLSVAAAGYLLSRVAFSALWEALKGAEAGWFAPAFVVWLLVVALRVWRWSVIMGGTPFVPTWHATTIGYFFNSVLPLRIGEIARVYVIARTTPLTMARTLSSVVVERLLDLASVVLLFAWFAQRIPMREAFTRAATAGSVIVIVGVALGALVVVQGAAVDRLLRPRLERRFGTERTASILGKLTQIREGIATIGSPRRLAVTLALTVLVWVGTILVAYLCLRAFLPEGTYDEAGLTLVVANLGGALPSAPGGLGIVQSFATSALVVPFSVPESTALAFVLVWSLSQWLLLIVLGFVSVGRLGLSFAEIRAGASGPKD